MSPNVITNISLAEFAGELLDNACPSSFDHEGSGFNLYWIETHCVGFWVSARKVNGVWEIEKATAEDC